MYRPVRRAPPVDQQLAAPLLVILVSLAMFAVLAVSVHAHALMTTSIDPEVAAETLGLRSPWATHVARALTLLGSETVVGSAAVLLAIVVLVRRGARDAAVVVSTMATSVALTVLLKVLLGRTRPGSVDRLGPVDLSYSFPSGHSLNSAVLLGLVCLLLVPFASSRVVRDASVVLCLGLAIGIGGSRVYLGYHWTTDVLASWCIAAVLVSVARVAILVLDRGREQSGSDQVSRRTLSS